MLPAFISKCSTIGPRLSAGKNVSAPTITITLTSSVVNSGVVTGKVPNDGGTAFFDEIGDLPLELQVKLLRLIQEKTFRRVGGTHDQRVDVRIVSATNRSLQDEVVAGRFREDLYYRLNVIEIPMPPLHERREDIALLVDHFVQKYARELGKPVQGAVHFAFMTKDRAAVRACHDAALKAGGRDNGPPGLRPQYHANYYGAFVLDPDGHNIEAVCHLPE